jgi:outer membrane protein OmpA-like peptidoglycan-associated protein
MNKTFFSMVFALLLGNIAFAHAAEEASPAALQQIETLQRRADKLAFETLDSNYYHLSKARAWLGLALSEYYEKDTSGILAFAIGQASALLDALESNQTGLGMDTPVEVPGSEAVRPDLLDKIAALKKHDKFRCGQRPAAEAEVYLVWAGHEFSEYGMSHAESYMRSVENLIHDAQVAIDNCETAPPFAQTSPALETANLSGDALFAFDKSTLNPDSLWRLDQLAGSIMKVTNLEEVTLVGHTDHMRGDGRQDRNQMLSERRAESVKRYLIGKGIPKGMIRAKGAGSSQPLVQCPSTLSKAEQIVCLQPNRRVEIILRKGNATDNNANGNKEQVK